MGMDLEPRLETIPERLQKTIQASIREKRFPLIFHGKAGTGKTMTALWIYLRAAYPFWSTFGYLVRKIVEARTHGTALWSSDSLCPVSDTTLIKCIEKASCLFLDDIGTRSVTDAQYDAFLDVLNARTHKPLIATSNLSLEDLDKGFDNRISSRLLSGDSIQFDGADLRLT